MTPPFLRRPSPRGRRPFPGAVRSAVLGAAGTMAGLPWAAHATDPSAGDATVPVLVIAVSVAALAGLGTLAARRLFAGARRPGRTPNAAARAPLATAVAAPRDDARLDPPTAPMATPAAVRPEPPLSAPPTAVPAAVPATAEPSGRPRSELDTIRLLSREVYWEQDEHGVVTRVDDGPVPSPLKLKLGRRRWDDGATPLDAPDWDAHRQALERREPFSELAWVWVDPSGRVRVAVDAGLPRHDASGRFVGYAGVSRDAGAEVVSERARRLAVAALLAAAEPVVWIEAGAAGTTGWHVIWANAAACRLFDRTERELRQLPCRTLFGADSQGVPAGLELALRARRETRMHVDIARKYGETRSVELRLEPLPGGGALRPCAALLMHDRSADQARLQQDGRAIERLREKMRERSLELEVTAKELESFTYTVSHDLRAPIRVVEGFARILQEDYGDRLDRIGHDHLQRILSAAARMTQMIDALLGLSRLSGQPVVPEQVDLSRLADTIVEELRAGDPQRAANVVVQPGMTVEGDRTLLRVMLENLIGNAWKYTGKRPEARIEFGCTGTGVEAVWCVADNGEGFDMRFADRLFGVFQRLHGSAEFPGTGVGLATVQRIVRRHGGRVWADSEPGRGSRFYFTLWEKAGR
jgi:signal transduction histidine kinase